MVVISKVVVAPSMGVHVPVNVGLIDVGPVDVAPVDVSRIDVAPVEVSPIDIGPVDISAINVGCVGAGRSVSDRRPRTASASRDASFRYIQPHAAHDQNGEYHSNLSHGSLPILEHLFPPIYTSKRLQSAAWRSKLSVALRKAFLEQVSVRPPDAS